MVLKVFREGIKISNQLKGQNKEHCSSVNYGITCQPYISAKFKTLFERNKMYITIKR